MEYVITIMRRRTRGEKVSSVVDIMSVCPSVCPCLSYRHVVNIVNKTMAVFSHCTYDTEYNNTFQDNTFLCCIGQFSRSEYLFHCR